MKKQLKIVMLVFMVLLSCQKKEREPVVEDLLPEQQFKNEDPPEIMRLKPEYETEVKQWETLYNLELGMQKFQKTTEKDYGLLVEDLLRLEKELSTSDFPGKFNIPAIKSRVLVLKTHLLQTQSILNKGITHNDALTDQHTKIIVVFNAIKKQLAEALTNTITEELLKDIEQEELLKSIAQ